MLGVILDLLSLKWENWNFCKGQVKQIVNFSWKKRFYEIVVEILTDIKK